jgi:hypothetical protein
MNHTGIAIVFEGIAILCPRRIAGHKRGRRAFVAVGIK